MNWGAIESVIFSVGAFSWIVASAFVIVAQLKQIDYSSRAVIFLWAAFDLITLAVTPVLYELTYIDKVLARQVWYMTFSFIALSEMIAIGYIHTRFNLHKSDLAKFVMFALVGSIFINIIRYFDRLVLETDMLSEMYRYGLMSLKIFVLVVFAKRLAKGKGVSFAS